MTLDQVRRLLNDLQSNARQDMRRIVTSSRDLKAKIRSLFLDLEVNTVPLEVFRELFQLDHLVGLIDLDRTSYLTQLLNKSQNRSVEFLSSFFIYFLCDRDYEPTNPKDQERFQTLLKLWMEHIIRDGNEFKKFISKLDGCIEHLISVSRGNEDHRLANVTDRIIEQFFRTSEYCKADEDGPK